MRKVIIMFALAMGIITANAQENVSNADVHENDARAGQCDRLAGA